MNSNGQTLNQGQLEAMLKTVSQRLGVTPEALKQAAQNGELSQVLDGAGARETEAVKKVLSDPEAAKKLLSSPQARKLMELLQGDK